MMISLFLDLKFCCINFLFLLFFFISTSHSISANSDAVSVLLKPLREESTVLELSQLVSLLNQFSASTNIPVRITMDPETATLDNYLYAVKDALDPKSNSYFDLIALDVNWIDEWTDSFTNLLSLNSFISSDVVKGISNLISIQDSHIVNSDAVNGRVVALPFHQDYLVLYYRQDILNRYNLSIPTRLEDIGIICEAITAAGDMKDQSCLSGFFSGPQDIVQQFATWFKSHNSIPLFQWRKRVAFDNDLNVKTLSLVTDFINKGYIAQKSFTHSYDILALDFVNGDNVFFYGYLSNSKSFGERTVNTSIEIYVADYIVDTKFSPVLAGTHLAMMDDPTRKGYTNKTAVALVLEFLSGTHVQRERALEIGAYPSIRDVLMEPLVCSKINCTSVNNIIKNYMKLPATAASPYWNEAVEAMAIPFRQILSRVISPEAGLATAAASVNSIFTSSDDRGRLSTAVVIILSVLIPLLVIAFIIILWLLYRHRRKYKSKSKQLDSDDIRIEKGDMGNVEARDAKGSDIMAVSRKKEMMESSNNRKKDLSSKQVYDDRVYSRRKDNISNNHLFSLFLDIPLHKFISRWDRSSYAKRNGHSKGAQTPSQIDVIDPLTKNEIHKTSTALDSSVENIHHNDELKTSDIIPSLDKEKLASQKVVNNADIKNRNPIYYDTNEPFLLRMLTAAGVDVDPYSIHANRPKSYCSNLEYNATNKSGSDGSDNPFSHKKRRHTTNGEFSKGVLCSAHSVDPYLMSDNCDISHHIPQISLGTLTLSARESEDMNTRPNHHFDFSRHRRDVNGKNQPPKYFNDRKELWHRRETSPYPPYNYNIPYYGHQFDMYDNPTNIGEPYDYLNSPWVQPDPYSYDKRALKVGNAKMNESKRFTVVHPYKPILADELELTPGEVVLLRVPYDDGYAFGEVESKSKMGVFPLACLLPVGLEVGFPSRLESGVLSNSKVQVQTTEQVDSLEMLLLRGRITEGTYLALRREQEEELRTQRQIVALRERLSAAELETEERKKLQRRLDELELGI